MLVFHSLYSQGHVLLSYNQLKFLNSWGDKVWYLLLLNSGTEDVCRGIYYGVLSKVMLSIPAQTS